MRPLIVAVCLAVCAIAASGGEVPDLVVASFADGKGPAIDHDADAVELSVGPRSPTERDPVLKFVVRGGTYPGLGFTAPQLPKDWSAYEALSFTVWSNADGGLGVRVDDEKSAGYATRFNGHAAFTKGRTRVQIPIANLVQAIDVHRVRMLVLFLHTPPVGYTLWFDDVRLGRLQADQVDFIPYEQRCDHQPSLAVASPHLPFGRGLAGGPLKAFLLTSVRYGRETVELMQRLDLAPSVQSWDREWDANAWGHGDAYGKRGHDLDCALMQRYLASSMQGPERFEALVMHTPTGWNRFGPGARKAIVERVKERGEGLVMVMPYPGERGQPWPDDLREICALIDSETDFIQGDGHVHQALDGTIDGQRWVAVGDHPITRGVPLDALPFAHMRVQRYALAPGAQALISLASGEPVLAVRQVGKGRVVTIAARAASLTAEMKAPTTFTDRPPYRYWEAWYDLLGRAAAWAGGRDLRRDGSPSVLAATGDDADPWFSVRQWRDAQGGVTDWELNFANPDPLRREVALAAPEVVAPGGRIAATFTVPEGLADARWTAELGELGDGRWRTLESIEAKAGTIDLPTDRVRQPMALIRLRAWGTDRTRLLAEGRAEVVVTPDPVWDDYETLSWLDEGLPFLVDFEMGRMRAFGLTGNTVGPWDKPGWRTLLRGGLRLHACGFASGLHADGLVQQMTAWRETHDRQHLVRHPSWADPEFVAEQRRKTEAMARAIAPYAPISLITSDETSLTSYTAEFDLDEHPASLAAFRAKLQQRFGDIAALNAAFATEFAGFDDIVPVTGEEAKASGRLGLWNAWRAHNDDQWAGAFRIYREAAQAGYPQARLSVSGTQEQAPFNGIDWAKLAPELGAVCGYGGRAQELQRLCWGHDELKAAPWCAYGRSGPSVDHQLWSNLVTGSDGTALFWWYSLRDYDLTFCRSGRDYQRVLAELLAGTGKQYMHARREFSPVAMLWSANSQRAAWAAGRFAEFKQVEGEVLAALRAAGFDPSLISEDEVAAGELERRAIRVVVLPLTISLGRGSAKGGVPTLPALEQLVGAGGLVVATEPATRDEFLREAPAPARFAAWQDVQGDLVTAFAKAAARPHVRISGAHRTQATLHAVAGAAGARLLTLLREPIGTHEVVGADGVPYAEKDAATGEDVETALVEVAALGKATFHDCRRGEVLPVQAGAISVPMRAGEGHPIAVLAYAVTGLTAEAAVVDRALTISWRLAADAPIANHVARVEVVGPDGAPLRHLCRNPITGADGRGSVVLPLATEDAPTTWRVRVRDVLTGRVTEATPR